MAHLACVLCGLLCPRPAIAQITLPPHFSRVAIAGDLFGPVAIAFASDGRLFVAEQRGVVRVFVDGVEEPQFFIDLRDEVGGAGFRGMLGLALDPNFLSNRRVYLAYTVDPTPGEPDEPDTVPSFNRLTRYTGTLASDGNIANPASRLVLIGAQPSEGIPVCRAHTIDALRFGLDGTLLIACGDGGHYEFADAGGNDPGCFEPPLFGAEQDLGAFRAQSLASMNGKILRVDPNTGNGLPTNPYWDGNATSNRSRIWVSGLRNPFRFCVRPPVGDLHRRGAEDAESAEERIDDDALGAEGALISDFTALSCPPRPLRTPRLCGEDRYTNNESFGAGPGVLYIGDVGWNTFEEVNVSATGGENFGWPCREGFNAAPEYPKLTPAASGCDTIQTPANPGPLTDPIAAWHHTNASLSVPPGSVGANAVGGAFYTGGSYPLAYQGAYFYADFVHGWMKVLKVDASHDIVNHFDFAENTGGPVDLIADPITGDLCYVSLNAELVYRITYSGPGTGDINGDGTVDVNDLLLLIGDWGPCAGGPQVCPADINGDAVVDVNDLLLLIGAWG